MQIRCSRCGKTNNAILTQLTLSYGLSSDIPIYNCENCGCHYIKIFSHAMQIALIDDKLKPVGEIIYNGFLG
jgi:uncharacterized Zn finger protein